MVANADSLIDDLKQLDKDYQDVAIELKNRLINHEGFFSIFKMHAKTNSLKVRVLAITRTEEALKIAQDASPEQQIEIRKYADSIDKTAKELTADIWSFISPKQSNAKSNEGEISTSPFPLELP